MGNLLCLIGMHSWHTSSEFRPSISALVVTDFISHTECRRCGKVANHTHWVWDEDVNDFHDWTRNDLPYAVRIARKYMARLLISQQPFFGPPFFPKPTRRTVKWRRPTVFKVQLDSDV